MLKASGGTLFCSCASRCDGTVARAAAGWPEGAFAEAQRVLRSLCRPQGDHDAVVCARRTSSFGARPAMASPLGRGFHRRGRRAHRAPVCSAPARRTGPASAGGLSRCRLQWHTLLDDVGATITLDFRRRPRAGHSSARAGPATGTRPKRAKLNNGSRFTPEQRRHLAGTLQERFHPWKDTGGLAIYKRK